MRILVAGVFDLFHFGHMRLLKKCRELYPKDTIIVGVLADDLCVEYKRKTIMSSEERIKSIKEFGIADEILMAPIVETKEFYAENDIDLTVHAHSQEEHDFYSNNFYSDAAASGMLRVLDYSTEISTSDIIKRCREL